MKPEDIWILEKDANGFSSLVRAADIPGVKELYYDGYTKQHEVNIRFKMRTDGLLKG